MNYSQDIDKILKSELSILIDHVRNHDYPFNENAIKENYEIYKNFEKVLN